MYKICSVQSYHLLCLISTPSVSSFSIPLQIERSRKKILKTVRAIEVHMELSCIAMGILQTLSIRFIGKVCSSQIRYQRTPSKGRVSEAALMHYFRKHFFRLLEQKPKSYITQIIHELQEESEKHWDFLAS